MQQGRRRNTPISLAPCAGSYQASADGRLITRPDQGPAVSPWRPPVGADLLEDMKQYFGSDAETEAHARQYIRHRSAQMKLNGEPLGILTGEYRKRPRHSIDRPTEERIQRGKEAGECLDRRQLTSDKGEPLNVYVTEISPVLKELKRRNTIDHDEYHAALQFTRDFYGSKFPGPTAVKYKERVDGGTGRYIESDHVIACRQRFHRAWDAVDPILHAALAWLCVSIGDTQPLSKLGSIYCPDRPTNTQSTRGADALRFALSILCRFYGINHKWARLSESAKSIVAMLD
jgi:hypothetical protein